jgi:hypothetical protein
LVFVLILVERGRATSRRAEEATGESIVVALFPQAQLLQFFLRWLVVGSKAVLKPAFSLALCVTLEDRLHLHGEPYLTCEEGRLPWPVLNPFAQLF